MKNFKSFFAVVCAALLSLPFVACEKPGPEPEPGPEPGPEVNPPVVTVTAGEAGITTLSFTITPENAEQCAWVCLEPESEIPTAETILAKTDNAVSATEATTVEISDLLPNTEYIIFAAVGNSDAVVMSDPVSMKTLDEDGVRFHEAIAEVHPGSSIVTFIEESGTYQLSFLFYYDSDAKHLPAGTYTIGGSSETPGTIDGDVDYTQLRLLKEDKIVAINGGTVNVEVRNNGTYNIVAEFTTDAGEFKTLFTGDIDGLNLSYNFTATSAKYLNFTDGVPGEFRIRLNGENCQLVLDLFANSGAAALPEGVYTVGAGTAPGTIGSNSYIDIFASPYSMHETFVKGTVDVKITNFTYTFDIKLENADGFQMNGTFTGQISEVDYIEGVIVAESAIAIPTGSDTSTRQVSLRFFRGEDQLTLATIYDINAKYLPSGTYIVSNSDAAGTINNDSVIYTNFYYNEEILDLISGTMTVNLDLDTEVYDITVEYLTAKGDFKISYKGKIEGFTFNYDLSSLSSAIRMTPDGEVPGEYFIKIEDNPTLAYELHLDLFADPASKTLPEGTYTVGTGTNPGTIGSNSFLKIKYPANTVDTFATGTIVVTKKDDVYTFVIDLYNADGYRMAGTFTGKIVGMEREEETDRIVIDCTYIKKGPNCDKSKGHAYWYMGNSLLDSVDVELYNDGSSLLPAGTYTVGTGTNAGTIVLSDGTYLTTKMYDRNSPSKVLLITEGTMTVEVNGDIYNVKFDFTAENGDKFRAKYEGSVDLEDFAW